MALTRKPSKVNKTIGGNKRPRRITKPPRLGEAQYWVGTHAIRKPKTKK